MQPSSLFFPYSLWEKGDFKSRQVLFNWVGLHWATQNLVKKFLQNLDSARESSKIIIVPWIWSNTSKLQWLHYLRLGLHCPTYVEKAIVLNCIFSTSNVQTYILRYSEYFTFSTKYSVREFNNITVAVKLGCMAVDVKAHLIPLITYKLTFVVGSVLLPSEKKKINKMHQPRLQSTTRARPMQSHVSWAEITERPVSPFRTNMVHSQSFRTGLWGYHHYKRLRKWPQQWHPRSVLKRADSA